MTAPRSATRTLRGRLFGSHLAVMGVALVVLGAVIGLAEAIGEGQALHLGRRGDGPTALILGLVAATIAAAWVSWRITRRLVKPLDDIGAAARELAIGRYDVRVPGADTAELDALAADVNSLAHELDITEQRRLRLIGDVAHELRNPLATIEGTMEALLDGVMAPDDETYARVGREAARLRRLADDLSSLSAAGELGEVALDPVDIRAVAADVVAQLEPQAVATGLELGLRPGPAPTIRGDRDRLTQVLTNVVGNAVQYTDAGQVTVGIVADRGEVIVEVADTGRGLTEADQERIFERFHRVDEHFGDGTGVGLAIAKLIVEAHGGTIAATSPGVGAGTTVRIVLPAGSG